MSEYSNLPPVGSTIEVTDDQEGRTYRWRYPRQWVTSLAIGGVLGATVVSSVILLVIFVLPKQALLVGPERWLIVLGPLVPMCVTLVLFYLIFRRTDQEWVTLGQDSFSHNAGTISPLVLPLPAHMRGGDSSELLTRLKERRKKTVIPKLELGEVVLERDGKRQRLSVEQGADRIEIGPFLREPEREWLAAEIHEWQQT